MKNFKLNEKGDVEIIDNKIQMVEGNELLRQSVQQVLGTNKGEWSLNADEGITFSNILGKHGNKAVEKQENAAMKSLYNKEVAELKNNDAELAQKLQKRLEGIQ